MLYHVVEQVLSGDVDAFREVIDEFGESIRAFLASHLDDPFIIEDLAQETFIAAYENLKKFEPDGNMSWWLKGIARNKLLLHFRETYRHQEALKDLKIEMLNEPQILSESAENASEIDRMRVCLEKLPQHLKTVITARYLQHEKVMVISQRIGTSVNAISSLLFRGRKQLKTCIDASK
jgi:RNA polymerase sigma-70 factor (ECF subfamily)